MSEQDDLLDQAFDSEGDEEGYDLSDVQEQSFSALPAGDYVGEVIEVKYATVKGGKNKGAPKFAIRFAIEGSKKPIFAHWVLTGDSAGWTKGKLKALGVDVTEKVTPSKVMNKVAVLTLSVRADKPSENEIESINSDEARIDAVRSESGAVEADDFRTW